MSNGMKISAYQRPVNLLEISNRGKAPTQQSPVSNKGSFKDVLSTELNGSRGVTFSKHASQRLHSRGIELSDEKLLQISQGIDKAETKGSRETLILTDDAALVVSVKSRTVITAFDRENLKEGVVTSIDSAVII
ncbi:MAG: TIGR02530 family flagellar biosynthesis protein [candidate division Zixibacteria bacterium]|nr:TIGR02530 family flagellar biosynthesis protein [candidate division Zixibacteria bacterium]